MVEWRGRNMGDLCSPRSGGGVGNPSQEPMEHRIPGITRGEPDHLVASVPLEGRALRRIARRLAYQRRGEHPRGFDPREISLPAAPALLADPPRTVATSRSPDLPNQSAGPARACQAVRVHARPQLAVRAARAD